MRKSNEAPRELREMLKTFSTFWSPENILLVTTIHILQKIAQVLKKSSCELTNMKEDYKNV